MVIGVLPLAALFTTFTKQIAKPMSKKIINQARKHPVFKKYCLIYPGQLYHWLEVRTMAKLNRKETDKPRAKVKVKQLNELVAISLGADLMSEIIIFIIGGATVVYEVNKAGVKSAAVEAKRKQDMQDLLDEKDAVEEVVAIQDQLIKKLEEYVEEYSSAIAQQVPEKRPPGSPGGTLRVPCRCP